MAFHQKNLIVKPNKGTNLYSGWGLLSTMQGRITRSSLFTSRLMARSKALGATTPLGASMRDFNTKRLYITNFRVYELKLNISIHGDIDVLFFSNKIKLYNHGCNNHHLTKNFVKNLWNSIDS
jgi:hypothetical protein